MEQAGCFFLVNADETKTEKSVAAEEYPELLERLTDLMRREARYQKTLARQWNQPEYALFAAIRRVDFKKVRAMCEAEPDLVNAVAPKKPIDSTYLSPLQVALSAGWIRQVNWHTWVNRKEEIARYLLERGADVNYCPADTHGKVDDPVLHSAVINAAWNLPRTFLRRNLKNGVLLGSRNEIHTAKESDAAFAFLESMLERGADPNLCHRDGRNELFEAVGGCAFAYDNADVKTPELKAHIQRMIALLTDAGADKNNFSKISKKPSCRHMPWHRFGSSSACFSETAPLLRHVNGSYASSLSVCEKIGCDFPLKSKNDAKKVTNRKFYAIMIKIVQKWVERA